MKTALPPSPLLVVYCHEPTGKRGHICLKGIRQGQRQKRLLAVIHTYRHKRRGADLFVVPCGRHSFSAALRQTLEQRFEVLELSGWLLPGGVQMISPWECRWKKIARPILDSFIAELTSLLMADSHWPIPKKEPSREPDSA
jgi:hypothetical protein